MKNFQFYMPTEIVFGTDAVNHLPALLQRYRAKRVLLHFGSGSVERSGLLAKIQEILKREGIAAFLLGGVVPNPHVDLVNEGIALCRRENVDLVLGIGGGSALDSAKAIALAVPHEEVNDIWDLWSGKVKPRASLPLGVVLTLSATGTETSEGSVLSHPALGIKCGFNTRYMRPAFAILDPRLTMTLPPYQVACGVVDMMMHTMERFFTPDLSGNATTDALAAAVLKTIIRFGQRAYRNPQDEEAMSELMWCGSLAHNGLTGLGARGDWACHQMGHVLSLLYDVAHGASLSAVWGSWARHSMQKDLTRFVLFAKEVWGLTEGSDAELALAGIEITEQYWASIDMPLSLEELGCFQNTAEDFQKLATYCTYGESRTIGQYPVLGTSEIAEIYAAANNTCERKR